MTASPRWSEPMRWHVEQGRRRPGDPIAAGQAACLSVDEPRSPNKHRATRGQASGEKLSPAESTRTGRASASTSAAAARSSRRRLTPREPGRTSARPDHREGRFGCPAPEDSSEPTGTRANEPSSSRPVRGLPPRTIRSCRNGQHPFKWLLPLYGETSPPQVSR
jgi:hypothetical protein